MADSETPSTRRPITDCNVHLWDQRDNPVFWLSDRSLVRDMLGDYDTLPDTYTLEDYLRETAECGVSGIVWSDAGAADPVAAPTWVQRQHEQHGHVTAAVTLGDPTSAEFADLVPRWRQIPLVRSVRVRLVEDLAPAGPCGSSPLDDPHLLDNLALLAQTGLVATIEADGTQLDLVTRIARAIPDLRIVIDHFGWPTQLDEAGFQQHFDRLTELAAAPNVATRVDALGTIFGDWTTAGVRPWLIAAVDTFGPQRCMLGSDLPIERLRSGFEQLYQAYREIFAHYSDTELDMLMWRTAERWYGTGH